MPRCREAVPIDDYVLDVLMRDLIGHDQKPAAFIVYLHLFGQSHETNRAALAPVCARSPTQQDSPKAPSMRRSHICDADN